MHTRHLLISLGAATALVVSGGSVAMASTSSATPSCDEATAAVVDLRADLAAALAAGGGGATGFPNVDAVQAIIDALPDAIEPDGALTAILDLDAALDVAIGEQDEACDEPTSTPTATPTATATATNEPDPSDDLDCGDFATREAAQAKLDETPGRDPHRLDRDGDGIACEVDESEPPRDDDGDGHHDPDCNCPIHNDDDDDDSDDSSDSDSDSDSSSDDDEDDSDDDSDDSSDDDDTDTVAFPAFAPETGGE